MKNPKGFVLGTLMIALIVIGALVCVLGALGGHNTACPIGGGLILRDAWTLFVLWLADFV